MQNSGGLTAGTYELISYSSLTNTFNPASLVIGSLPEGFCGVVVNNAAASQIDLNVYVPKRWTGSNGSAWDTTTANWTLSGGTATYANGDPVLFDDTAAAGSVSVVGTVTPLTMMVNNNSLSYTFSGSGCIAGATLLTKLGSGTLAMNTASNTYAGGTILNGGVLQLGASSAISGGTLRAGPLGTGTVYLASGTLQDDGGGRTLANAVDITGSVTLASADSNGLTFGPQGLSTPNTVTLSGSPTITVTAPTTIADQITGGALTLVMAGSGTVTLTASANTYTGPTSLSGGSLVGTVADLPTEISLANNANVTFNQNTARTLSNYIGGVGSLTKTGTAVLTMGAATAYLGPTAINAGTLRLTPAVPNPGLLIHCPMDGPLGPIATGGTIADVSGNNYYGTLSSAGTYVFGKFGQGLTLNGGYICTVASTAVSTLRSWTDSVWINVGSTADLGSDVLVSARDQDPTAAFVERYTGSAVQVWDVAVPSSGWVNPVEPVGSYSLSLGTNAWHMVTVTVSPSGASNGAWQIYVDGSLDASGTFSGTPQMVQNGTTNGMYIGGRPGYAGMSGVSFDDFYLFNTVLSANQVQRLYQNQVLYFGSVLPTTTPVQLASGGTLDLNGVSQTIGSLANGTSGGGIVTNSTAGTATLTLAPTGSTTFSGRIQNGTGQVALILNGPGIQILAASNTYTGGTQIDEGTLVASNSNGSATGSGAVTLSGGTLASGASGSISGTVTVASAASEIAPGGIGSIGNLTIGSLITGSNLTTLNFDLTTPGGSGDLLTIANGLTLAPGTAITFGVDPTSDGDYRLIGGSFGSPTLSYFDLPTAPPGLTYSLSTTADSGHIDLVVSGVLSGADVPAAPGVPEPSTVALLGVAAIGLFGYAWRRRQT